MYSESSQQLNRFGLKGVSCFFGLAVTCLFLPLNHFAGKVVVGAQENLMKARDERVALMNEVCYYPRSYGAPNLSIVGPWRNPDA